MRYPGRLEFVFYGANLIFEEEIPATITNCKSETFVYADYVKVALSQRANIAIAPLEDIPTTTARVQLSSLNIPLQDYRGFIRE